nr:hypothetical protein [Tanacetum cinerariifolium]
MAKEAFAKIDKEKQEQLDCELRKTHPSGYTSILKSLIGRVDKSGRLSISRGMQVFFGAANVCVLILELVKKWKSLQFFIVLTATYARYCVGHVLETRSQAGMRSFDINVATRPHVGDL